MMLNPEVEESLLALPLEERARLADRLLGSLESEPSADWHAAVDREISDRIAAEKRGEIKVLDGDEVLAKLWKRLDA